MAEEFQEKTETATPKQREKARDEGQVAKSQEINSAAMLFFGLLILYFFSGHMYNQIQMIFKKILLNLHNYSITPETVLQMYVGGLVFLGGVLLPVLVSMAIVGFSAAIGQVGFHPSIKAARPKFSKLNPISGFKKVMISKKSLEELIKNVVKITVILYVAYRGIASHTDEFTPLVDQDIQVIFKYILDVAFEVCMKIALIFIVIGFADFAFQKYDHENELKMTKQQVKDETKESEGDPKIKAAIRRKQLETALRRMMQEVPTADVVITNPTHYAIALKYDVPKMEAPKVVAKGKDLIAQKIKEIAKENNVPIIENPPLVRALFEAVEIGQYIPEKYFQAIAEVLAYVYNLKNKKLN